MIEKNKHANSSGRDMWTAPHESRWNKDYIFQTLGLVIKVIEETAECKIRPHTYERQMIQEKF